MFIFLLVISSHNMNKPCNRHRAKSSAARRQLFSITHFIHTQRLSVLYYVKK